MSAVLQNLDYMLSCYNSTPNMLLPTSCDGGASSATWTVVSTSCSAVLCCAVLCCAVLLCCVMLCCAVLRCALLWLPCLKDVVIKPSCCLQLCAALQQGILCSHQPDQLGHISSTTAGSNAAPTASSCTAGHALAQAARLARVCNIPGERRERSCKG